MKSNLTLFAWQLCILMIFISLFLTVFASVDHRMDDDDDDEQSDEIPDFEFDHTYNGHGNPSRFVADDYDDLQDVTLENQTNVNYVNRERKIRQVLIRALANTKLRQKFVEVMPVLRMMTKAQRLTLAALIQAQVDGHRVLTLDQVKQLFGNREDLILPLILDIANLIKIAAENAYAQRQKVTEFEQPSSMQLLRRSFFSLPRPEGFKRYVERQTSLRDTEESDEEETQATVTDITKLVVANMKDDRMHIDDKDLEAIVRNISHERNKRDKEMIPVALPLVLTHPIPEDGTEQDHIKKKLELTYHERKMNMTSFNATKQHEDQTAMASDHGPFISFALPDSNMTRDEIEDLTFDAVGTTTFNPIMSQVSENASGFENLPQPEQLIRVVRPKLIQNNRPVGAKQPIRAQRPALRKQTVAPVEEVCEKFSSTVCISVKNYPTEQVMRSIRRHKTAMHALLADFKDKAEFLGPEEYFDSIPISNRRQDGSDKGQMCESIIKFARPQKARSATGEWKYIVNTGSHTQTLRLEKCSAPLDSCNYLTDNYRSRCIQVYNYHRLLSWDVARGLHVDIFKVPTCCSCHIDGYKESFPPLADFNKDTFDQFELDDDTHLQAAAPSNIRYSTLKDLDDIDSEDDDEDDNIAYQYTNGFKRKMKPLKPGNHQTMATSGSNRQTVRYPVNTGPALDEYLSPPVSSYDPTIQFKSRTPIIGRRRPGQPIRKQSNDQQVAGSDFRSNEVTVLPPVAITPRKRVTPAIASTASTTVNVKLLKTATDGNKRVNYNYHPIIDFFESQENKQRQGNVDRIGNVERVNPWRPVVGNNNNNYNRRGAGGMIRGI